MPQRQPIVRTGGRQQSVERAWFAAFEALHAAAQRIRRVLEIRNARTAVFTRGAGGASGDEGFAIAHLEGHPAEGDAQPAVTLFIDVEGVLAAQVDGARRGRIDHKFARGSPDEGVQFAALQGEALAAASSQYRVGRQVHAADLLGFQTYRLV